MAAVILLAVILVAAGAGSLVQIRRRRTPRELRGDWRTPFEREFRAYVRKLATSPRDGHRRRGENTSG